jgi:hypothetical protein
MRHHRARQDEERQRKQRVVVERDVVKPRDRGPRRADGLVGAVVRAGERERGVRERPELEVVGAVGALVERREDEITLETRAVGMLREEAELWAQAWVDAMYQQNLYNRGEYVKQLAEQKSDERNWLRKGSDWVGFTENNALDDANSEVPIEPHPPKPTPPSYTATATEKQYL